MARSPQVQLISSSNRRRTMVRRIRRGLGRLALYVVAAILAFTFTAPTFWTISSSLKKAIDINYFPPTFWPAQPQWHNYAEIWIRTPWAQWTQNSLIVATAGVVGAVLGSAMTAYAFSRFRFPGRNLLFMVCLSTLVLPGEVTIIPQYLMFHKIGWLNTLLPLTVPAFFGGGAFYIFMMRQFFLTVPTEMDEAAKIDGANSLRIFFQLLLPVSKPVLATAAIFSFLGHWNDFWGPLIYLNSKSKFTLALGLQFFTAYAEFGDLEQTQHLLMAASVTMSIPCIILFFVAQRYFIRGIVLSAAKG